MELIKPCASFVNDSTPKMCTSLSCWWVAETLEAQAVSMGTGVSVQWPSCVAGDAESDGALGCACPCASSLQADCEGALSEAGADLPCLASRLSCVKLVTLSFPQISTGY